MENGNIVARQRFTCIDDIRNISEKISKAELSDSDKNTFRNGEYETYRLLEPLTVYRYFGSVSAADISDIRPNTETTANPLDGNRANDLKSMLNDTTQISSPEELREFSVTIAELFNKDINDWGSDAGGRFLGLNPNLTPEQAKELLALNPEWGNSEAYLATIELPAGTEISVGIAGPQRYGEGKTLCGGEIQVFLQEWTTEKTKEWIKECKPTKEFVETKNESFDDGYYCEDAYMNESQERVDNNNRLESADIESDGYFPEDAYMNNNESKDAIKKEIM